MSKKTGAELIAQEVQRRLSNGWEADGISELAANGAIDAVYLKDGPANPSRIEQLMVVGGMIAAEIDRLNQLNSKG